MAQSSFKNQRLAEKTKRKRKEKGKNKGGERFFQAL